MTTVHQSHEGAVSAMTTPKVQYAYDADATSGVYTDNYRLQTLTYPGASRAVTYDYGAADSLDDRADRIAGLEESSSTIVSYERLGAGRVASVDYPAPDVRLTYHHGDSDGVYEGFDRFGRVIDQYWDGYNSTADVDRFGYTYDRAGNRLTRDIDSAIYATNDKDQAYTHDGLHRVTSFDRGTLSGGSISTPNFEQDWKLDGVGNWTDFDVDPDGSGGTPVAAQDRTHNAANELTNFDDAWIDPSYDANGNMTVGPSALRDDQDTEHRYVYDAWNRLVKVTNATPTMIATYEYDGQHRRIVKDVTGGDTFDYYYNEDWQLLEIRKDADVDPYTQHAWHPHYIDALAYWWQDTATTGTAGAFYATHDANFNTTATGVTDDGDVLFRYEYDAYGVPTRLLSNFTSPGSPILLMICYAGYFYDEETGLHHVRNRMLHSSVGRWMQRDPAGYVDGMSLYEYVKSRPLIQMDPSGLLSCVACKKIAFLLSAAGGGAAGAAICIGLGLTGAIGGILCSMIAAVVTSQAAPSPQLVCEMFGFCKPPGGIDACLAEAERLAVDQYRGCLIKRGINPIKGARNEDEVETMISCHEITIRNLNDMRRRCKVLFR